MYSAQLTGNINFLCSGLKKTTTNLSLNCEEVTFCETGRDAVNVRVHTNEIHLAHKSSQAPYLITTDCGYVEN